MTCEATLKTLTEEQYQQIEAMRGQVCSPEYEKAEKIEAVKTYYQNAGLVAPEQIYWCETVEAGEQMLLDLESQGTLGEKVSEVLHEALRLNQRNGLWDVIAYELDNDLWYELEEGVLGSIEAEIESSINSEKTQSRFYDFVEFRKFLAFALCGHIGGLKLPQLKEFQSIVNPLSIAGFYENAVIVCG